MLPCCADPSPTSVQSLTQVQCCCVFLFLALPQSSHWRRYNVAVSLFLALFQSSHWHRYKVTLSCCSWQYISPVTDTGTMLLCFSVPSPTSVHSLTQVQCCCVFLLLALFQYSHWHRYNVAVSFCSWPCFSTVTDKSCFSTVLPCLAAPGCT